jgi:hypothetical protein
MFPSTPIRAHASPGGHPYEKDEALAKEVTPYHVESLNRGGYRSPCYSGLTAHIHPLGDTWTARRGIGERGMYVPCRLAESRENVDLGNALRGSYLDIPWTAPVWEDEAWAKEVQCRMRIVE